MVKRVYFVRHGETESNFGGMYQSPDVGLSETGFKGAEAVALRCEHIDVDVIVASPFVRAQQTALAIQKRIGKPLTTFEYAHEVCNARKMWGKRFDSEESVAYEKERQERFADETWTPPEGAETYSDVSRRVDLCIAMLEESQEQHIVFVSHGNFLRFLLARLLLGKNSDAQTNMTVYASLLRMSNVAISECVFVDGRWSLFTWNDTAHFAE